MAVLEEIADQPACARGDHHRVRLGQGLQAGGQVRRFADDRLFLRRAFADQIADNHQPGGDPDARLQLDGLDVEATHRIDRAQPRSHRPLGVVLMRLRVAEIDQYAVAHVPGDKTIALGDFCGDSAVIRGDDLAQILGIKLRGECGRADQVAEHHGELPALRGRVTRGGLRCGNNLAAQHGDCRQQFAPMPDEADAEVLEVVGGQLRQYRDVDRVFAKRLFVFLHAEAVEPGCNVHARPPRRVRRCAGLPYRRLRSAREKSARRVAGEGHAVHHAAKAVIIVDRVVLGAAIVPEGERTDLPAKAAGEFRALLMGEQIIQQRGALRLAHVLEAHRVAGIDV